MKTRALTALSALGLFAAAAAWALHQQADYILASLACRQGVPMMWVVTLLALVLIGTAGIVALRMPRSEPANQPPNDPLRPHKFLAALSSLGLLLFLFAMFLQASATLFLPSCAAG